MYSLFFTVEGRATSLPLYVTSVGHHHQVPKVRDNGLPDFQWLHTLRGRGIVELEGKQRELHDGQGFFMFPHVPHRYWPIDKWEVQWLTFGGNNISAFLTDWDLTTGFVDLVDMDAVTSLINEMRVCGLEPSPLQAFNVSALAYHLLNQLAAQMSRQPKDRKQHTRLAPLLQYISDNLHTDLTLPAMAKLVGVSPQHMCRLFQSIMGTTLFKYITALRIGRAKSLLVSHPELYVADVAKKVGFSSHSYFCSTFKNYEGRTPSDFRTLHLGLTVPPRGVEVEILP